MSDLPCPAHEQLQEYVTGILLWSTHEQVENHLDTCFDCQVRVDRIDQKSPALLVG